MTWPLCGSAMNWWTAPVIVLPVRVVEAPPAAEPLTLDDAKLRAGLDWTVGDPRDALMQSFIAAARGYVEQRTARAIPPQAHQLFYDGAIVATGTILTLPAASQPLISVEAITSTDAAGAAHVLDPAAYTVQLGRGLVQLVGPLPTDVRPLEGWRVDLTCGTDVAAIDPALLHVIGLLTAHYATFGRDIALVERGTLSTVPHGFDDAIAPFVPEVLP